MKTIIFILLLFQCFSLSAAELILESGNRSIYFARPDNYSPAHYSAVAIRFGNKYYLEAIQAGWHGQEYARFTGLGIGFKSQKPFFTELGFSLIHLTESTMLDQSGNLQVLLTTGLGYRYKNISFTYRFRHLSNGNSSDNNHGRDFKLFSVGILF